MPNLIDRKQSILTVIDVQEKLLPLVANNNEVEQNILLLLRASKLLEVPRLITEQYPKGLGSTVTSILKEAETEPEPGKTCFSSLGSDSFRNKLARSERKQLILCGIEAHVCVLQTAFELMDTRYNVFVVADAIGSRTRENHNLALRRMEKVGAQIVTTESVLFEWARDSKIPEFKTMSAWLKGRSSQ